MSEHQNAGRFSWLRSMNPRNPNEIHRQASFLELFFDLCFVVAIAQAASQLHHALAEDHIVSGIISFSMVFFAIWWAWMNFTWFASAYDNDDVPYRIVTFIQIAGALILAAGVKRGFVDQNFTIIVLGYVVMRLGLVSLWIRAAFSDPARKTVNMRYAVGIIVAQLGWVTLAITGYWAIWCFIAMVIVELLVPVWAENANKTPWHPDHIAERYGLLTIIVLGESVLAATNAVQAALDVQSTGFDELVLVIAGGLLLLFSMWWLYFSMPAEDFLNTKPAVSFGWGYGHYVIFATAAVVGAGIGVNIDHITGHTALSNPEAAATITVPVALYLITLWMFHLRPHQTGWPHGALFAASAVIILLLSFSPWPILLTGLITVATVIVNGIMCNRHKHAELIAKHTDA